MKLFSTTAFVAALMLSSLSLPADPSVYRQLPPMVLEAEGATGAWRAATYSPEAAALIREAIAATARGDNDEALALYRSVAQTHPAQGIPALARFLTLAKDRQETEWLLEELRDSSIDALTLSRVYTILGRDAEAADLLRESGGGSIEEVILAGRALVTAGRAIDGATLLVEAIEAATAQGERMTLLQEFLAAHGRTAILEPFLFQRALEGAGSTLSSHSEAAARIDPLIFHLFQTSGYFQRRNVYTARLEEESPLLTWFRARILVREEDFTAAATLLDQAIGDDDAAMILLEARAELARSLGDLPGARRFSKALARHPQATPRQQVEAARAALANRDFESAYAQLMAMDPTGLPDDVRRLRAIHLFQLAGFRNEPETVIRLYAQEAPRMPADDIELLHKVIFSTLIETDEHLFVEQRIRELFAEESHLPPILWRLAAASAAEARRTPNELEALYQGVLAAPSDLTILRTLADRATTVASEIASVPPEALIVTPDVVGRVQEVAEFSLRELIRLMPQDPTWAVGYIRYHENIGSDRIAERLWDVFPEELRTNGRALGVLAYALATNGFPEHAMELYDKAVALRPDDMDIRMNRASGLTRVGRWEEASAIYRDAIENGFKGRNYHVHEMIDRLWAIENHLGRSEQVIAYFKEIAPTLNEEWRHEALHDLGILMANLRRPDDARVFFMPLIEETDNAAIRASAWQLLANAYFVADQRAEASAILAEAMERTPVETVEYILLAQSAGEVHAESNEPDKAIAIFVSLAEQRPDNMNAIAGLFRAALIAAKAGKTEESEQLLRRFLDSDSTDFSLRREARRLLEGRPS